METNRLRQFIIVYETKNLRKAAEILNISHSAISKSLKVLQEELGKDFFRPEGRGIAPTDLAIEFYPKVQKFLKEVDVLFSFTQEKKTSPLRIVTFEVFSTYLLGSTLGRYFGDTPVQVYEQLPGNLEQTILNLQADVGISYEPIPTAGLNFLKIGRVQMKIYARKGSYKNTPFQDIPFVAPAKPIEGTPSGTKGLDGWPEHKIARHIKFQVDMMESGLSLARAGLAAIFLPQFIARFHNEVVKPQYALEEIPYPGSHASSIYRDVFLVKRNSTLEDKNIKILGKLLRTECIDRKVQKALFKIGN